MADKHDVSHMTPEQLAEKRINDRKTREYRAGAAAFLSGKE